MSNMVTRCPQCHTSFRVTEDHLKLANGAVRCGSCLLVFQARQHWINPTAETTATDSSSNTPTPNSRFQLDASSQNGAADSVSTAQPKIENETPADSYRPSETLDLGVPIEAVGAVANPKKIDDIGDDDKISDDTDLREEDEEPVIASSVTGLDSDYASVFGDMMDAPRSAAQDAALDNFNNFDDILDDTNLQQDHHDAAVDESWAKNLLDDELPKPETQTIDLNAVDDVRDILQDFANPVDVDAASRDLGFGHRDPFAAKDLGSTQGSHRSEMIAHIDPLPVDLLSTRAGQLKQDWKVTLQGSGIIAALFVLLIAQYVFFNFNRLAKTSTSRPYIQTICHVFRCELPVVENWRYIKIQNLVVRKHAQLPNALVVDAMLLNVTDQDLPFPALDLYFSDLVKTPIASRRFNPSEYLSGELSGQTMMPAGRPVHIALEVVNPGAEAVNWSMSVAGNVE